MRPLDAAALDTRAGADDQPRVWFQAGQWRLIARARTVGSPPGEVIESFRLDSGAIVRAPG